jgi:hypothetical protein
VWTAGQKSPKSCTLALLDLLLLNPFPTCLRQFEIIFFFLSAENRHLSAGPAVQQLGMCGSTTFSVSMEATEHS